MSIEKTYKKSSEWLFLFFSTIVSVVKVLLRLKHKSNLPKTDKKNCIVLGNGPSLKHSIEEYSAALKENSLICINSFSTTDQYPQLQPQYYVILDPAFWLNNAEPFVGQTFDAIINKTSWKLYLMVPYYARNSSVLTSLENKNKNIEIVYFNYTVFNGFKQLAHLLYRKNLAAPQSQNVLVVSLFLAINLGFKNIYLLGADHTWHENLHVNENNELCLKDVHFYDNEQKINYRLFYKAASKTELFKMHEILATFAKTFYGYHLIEDYAKYSDVAIFNASGVSYIDAFERKKINL